MGGGVEEQSIWGRVQRIPPGESQHIIAGSQPRQGVLSELVTFWRFLTSLFLRRIEPKLWEWNIPLAGRNGPCTDI